MKFIIKESQYVYILENLEKNKKFLTNVMGMDFTGKIKQVTSSYDVPMEFDNNISPSVIKSHLNSDGPMYLFELDDKKFLYQDKGHVDFFIDQNGYYYNDEIARVLGIDIMGLRFSDIIDMYFNEEEPLNENVGKNKRLLINVMGEDLTGKIKQIRDGSDIPKIFHRYLDLNGVKRQIEMVGPMYVVKIGGNYYLYQDQSHFYQSHNDASFGEMFMDEDGKRDYSGKILKELGIDIMGLRFSDIINMYFNEEESLNESTDKNKKFLTKHMGIDFTGKIKQITSAYKVPYNFYRNGGISLNHAMSYLNNFGPMYFFELGDYEYLYQDRGNKDWFIDERGVKYIKDEFSERLGLDVLGLRFSDIINMYFNEEETLNESLISEETNKSLRLITKYYDIEGDGSSYRGDNKIQTLVTFFPKDYDNEMSNHAGSSICNWEFDPPHDLIFKFMTLPSPSFIPLMDYVGETEDLEEYLEKIHRKEAEKFLIRLKKSRS